MAQTKKQIVELLHDAGGEPRKRFGQNFMIDANLVRIVADAGDVKAGELVIEVGPGTGTLTEELIDRGASVLAVEIDRDLAALLRSRLSQKEGFQLIEGDVLAGKHDLNEQLKTLIQSHLAAGRSVKMVANLPYNVASPLIIEMLTAGVGMLVFTVQKEVAERLRAKAGEDAYGGLSVMATMLSKVQVLRLLPPEAFWPAPNVHSALVKMVRENRLGNSAAAFGRFVASLFSYRRKTLRKALEMAGHAPEALERIGIDGRNRPEQITPEQFWALYQATAGL